MMLHRSVVMCVLLAGCAATASREQGEDAKLVGERLPLIGDGMRGGVYFTQVDTRELRNLFNQYPASITLAPGNHLVTTMCEWRSSLSDAPVVKNVRRFRMDVAPGRTYQFTSSYTPGELCQTRFEDITDRKPVSAVAQDAP